MLELCRRTESLCYIDDAHGFGVLGKTGRGIAELSGGCATDYADGYLLSMCTLGKAMGSFGAFVAGSDEMIETLIQQGRSYIYTTALPPVVAAASLAALRISGAEPWRRDKLSMLVDYFRAGCQQRNIPLLPSSTPIQPVLIGNNEQVQQLAERLQQQNLLVFAIRSPTVARGSERLRVTLSASHEQADVDTLLDALANAMNEIGNGP